MNRSSRKFLAAILCVFALTSASARRLGAAPPPTPRRLAPSTQPGDARPHGGYQSLSDDERKDFNKWLGERMPNLLKLANSANRPARRGRLLNSGLLRYRALQQIVNDPTSLERDWKSIKQEDQIFASMLELENTPADQRGLIWQKIRIQSRELVNGFLDERADRLKKLRARLDEEEKKLEEDRRNPDGLVEQRMQHFFVEFPPADSDKPADGEKTGDVISASATTMPANAP